MKTSSDEDTPFCSVVPPAKGIVSVSTQMCTCEQQVEGWLHSGAHPDDCKNMVSFSLIIVGLRINDGYLGC